MPSKILLFLHVNQIVERISTVRTTGWVHSMLFLRYIFNSGDYVSKHLVADKRNKLVLVASKTLTGCSTPLPLLQVVYLSRIWSRYSSRVMIQYGHPTINWHTVFIYFRNVKTLNALLSAELNTHYNNKKKSSMMETVPKKNHLNIWRALGYRIYLIAFHFPEFLSSCNVDMKIM